MSLQYKFDKLMKRIGAYTISDEVIELAELYRSQPVDWRRLLRALDDGLTVKAAARRVGIDESQAEAILDRIAEQVEAVERRLSGETPEPDAVATSESRSSGA